MTAQPGTLNGGWTRFQAVNGDHAALTTFTADLANILDTVDVPILVVGRDLAIAGFNATAADLLGLSPSDVGRPSSDITVLARIPRLEQECSKAAGGGVESRTDFHDGNKSFVVRISPYTGRDRQFTGALLTFTDVTVFRANTDQAIYERECTKAILNTVAEPLVVLSDDQRIQSGNRAFHAMFEVSRDEVQGVSLYGIGNGAFEHTALPEQLSKVLAGNDSSRSVEVDLVTATSQRTLSVNAHPLAFPGHSQRRALVTFQDITARKQAEAAKDLRSKDELRLSEAFLAEGQRLSMTGSFSWNVATDEIAWSEQLYRIYELAIGVPVTLDLIRTRVHPDDVSLVERLKMADPGLDGGGEQEWQYRLMMPDGSIKHLHAVAHATRDRDGHLQYIAAVQDVTAGRLSEEALAKARSELANVARISSLGVLTASIAHEVNQPLSGIITNAGTCLRMLDADPPDIEGARETARRTIRDGNRASDVITRLRALFSRGELTLESLDLNEVTRQVIALSVSDLQRNRVAVQSEFADDLPAVSGDRIQLQQVILNLVRNASDAMVDVDDRPRRLLFTTGLAPDDRVRLSVGDVGVGVDAEIMNKLFDAFYTTKSDGMGIGLSVSRSIIERHQGRLWAEPNDGPGATFSISIPAVRTVTAAPR